MKDKLEENMGKISNQLKKIAKYVGEFDERLANDLLDVTEDYEKDEKLNEIAEDLEDVVDELAELGDGVIENVDNAMSAVDTAIEGIEEVKEKTASIKFASLINEGDRIVCLNPLQGIFKGRIYIAGETVEPNYIVVKEENGERVGIYKADRFCLDNKEY